MGGSQTFSGESRRFVSMKSCRRRERDGWESDILRREQAVCVHEVLSEERERGMGGSQTFSGESRRFVSMKSCRRRERDGWESDILRREQAVCVHEVLSEEREGWVGVRHSPERAGGLCP